MDPDHEEEHNDDDDEGNVSKAVLELSGMVQDHPARILADTGAGLSIVSDSFINQTQSTGASDQHATPGSSIQVQPIIW
ncbi:hypothetical protein NDA10_001734 [Ustilago hordei]|nr:hypothetical protein NDA10_001734 [Ustilago hordei]